jgi:hypothetical protein
MYKPRMAVSRDQAFQMRVKPEFLALLDNWRRKQTPIPSRAAAIRKLVEDAARETRIKRVTSS